MGPCRRAVHQPPRREPVPDQGIPQALDAAQRLSDIWRRIMTRSGLIVGGSVFLFLLASSLRAGEPQWKQHSINGQSEFEAAGVFDVDNEANSTLSRATHG